MFQSVTNKLNEKLPHGLVMFVTLILMFAVPFSFYIANELKSEVRAITIVQKSYEKLSTITLSPASDNPYAEKIEKLNGVIQEKNQQVIIAYVIGAVSALFFVFFISVFKLKVAAFNENKNKEGKMECSECKELVMQGAKVCKHCGHHF